MHSDRNDPDIFTRRVDGAWRVVVREDGLEHVHRESFRDRHCAFDLADHIEAGLAEGYHLHLVHWEIRLVTGRFPSS